MKAVSGKAGDPGSPRILTADSEPIYLLGLRAVLEARRRFEIVGGTTNSRDLLSCIGQHKPEILLMGFRLSCGRDALGMAPQIHEISPETSTIILLPGISFFLTGRLLSAGVRGILARASGADVLQPAIEKVLGGDIFVDPELSGSLPRPESTAGQVDVGVLTSRELEVLRLFGMEKNYKEIASLLGLSAKTIGAHREKIKAKLRIGNSHAFFLIAKSYVLWESSGVDYLL